MNRVYVPTVDVWAADYSQINKLRPGQWVSAGTPDASRNNCGRFYGVKASGSVVVAWNGNARNGDYREYQKTIYNYAKGGR